MGLNGMLGLRLDTGGGGIWKLECTVGKSDVLLDYT